MSIIHGFELVKEADMPEINSHVQLFRHVRTGARLLSVANDDENKSFGVGFKTPPTDDTGLPHILEHSVLCGSRKYPTKEPFVELLKSSVNTFLNAMTFSDMTIYPVASTNLKDFYNLVDVYMDAVFYPLITEQTLYQEGWHYETQGKDSPLIYKGVVFNEMKAQYSMPDYLLYVLSETSLMPDTPYAHSSGGDPAAIPNLTYDQFKKFHETYYHPSNAFFFFFGDDDPEERLRYVDDFIKDFDALDLNVDFPLQTLWEQPRMLKQGYDAGDVGADEKKTMMTVNWLLPEVTDHEKRLALEILSHVLMGTAASPLRKTLIDSGLGEDVTGGGLSEYQRQMSFSSGLKGIKSEDSQKVEKLVIDTLSKLADDGIDKAQIEASINTTEFQLRELNTGGFPRGLALFISALPTWMHGGDPVEYLGFARTLNKIKEDYAQNPQYFEELIGQYLIDNPHRITVILEPDPEVGPKRDQTELDCLNEARLGMNDDDIAQLIELGEQLVLRQSTPDSPEDLAKIPTLRLSDLEREIKRVPVEFIDESGTEVLYHDLPTSEIAYLDIAFDIKGLPQNYLPYYNLYRKALLQMGTEKEDFVKLFQRIGAKTGGINLSNFLSMTRDGSDSVLKMIMRGKAMKDQTQELLNIISDVLHTVNFDNQERFLQIALEAKSEMESGITRGGQAIASKRVNAQFDEASWLTEEISGVTNLFFLRNLISKIEDDWDSVCKVLVEIHRLILNRSTMTFNVTLDAENWKTFQPQLRELINGLPSASVARPTWHRELPSPFEALTAPAQVNFVGKGANIYDLGYKLDGSFVAILKNLNMAYMWNRIRVQGGAYGGRAAFNPASGVLTFLSWRDPNLLGTLEVYDQAADYLTSIELSDDELEKTIIGSIGDLDGYQLPDAKGFSSLVRYLTGYTDEQRQEIRDQVFETKLDDFRKFGEVLKHVKDRSVVSVVCSPQTVEKVNASLEDKKFDVVKVL